MAHKVNSGSFKKGHIHSPETCKKRSETMKRLFAEGVRKAPGVKWSAERRKKYSETNRGKNHHGSKPLGTRRKHKEFSGHEYWEIKVSFEKRGWMYEHRYIMEQKLNRKLLRSEHIHHIDGNTLNNDIENLMIVSPKEHIQIHKKFMHDRGRELWAEYQNWKKERESHAV